MKKLLELEVRLKKAKEELEKQADSILGSMNPTGMPPGTAASGGVNMAKEDVETCGKMDSKKRTSCTPMPRSAGSPRPRPACCETLGMFFGFWVLSFALGRFFSGGARVVSGSLLDKTNASKS